METIGRIVILSISLFLALFLALYSYKAKARDQGQWEDVTPAIREWYRELKMPDHPQMSCCGEADAYYVRAYTKNGKNIAVITDDRPDAPLGRPHVPVGTEIVIPDHKMKWDRGNPTGHSIIFLSNPAADGRRDVYCYVDGEGI